MPQHMLFQTTAISDLMLKEKGKSVEHRNMFVATIFKKFQVVHLSDFSHCSKLHFSLLTERVENEQ